MSTMTTDGKGRLDDRADDQFFARLHRKRTGLGFTQSEIAKGIDVTVETVSNWEHGRRRPHPGPEIRALAEMLDTTVAWLLYGREEI
jgi:transcriptional regulator with XRE-family HTH domain